MGKKDILLISAIATLASNVFAADVLVSRSFASCGYVGVQIYCYGGDTSSSLISNMAVDSNIYSLNVAQFVGQATDSMSSQWNIITPANNFNTEVRRTPSAIVLPDGKRFLIQGGHNMAYQKFYNQTIIFDTTTKTWQSLSAYSEINRETRQIYFSNAVNLPNNMVGFYGGLEQLANVSVPEITATGATMPYDSNNGSYVGYRSLEMFSPSAMTWAQVTPQNNVPSNYYPNSQTATINPSTGKIYYFGGSYYTPSGGPIRSPLSWGYTFNTNSGTWTNETFGGVIPSNRLYHSANMLPNSQDIILYGGTDDGIKASTDYCFTLNLSNNTWTKQSNINVPSYLSGPRFTHSAVLVNTTLFILFGRGLDGTLNPSMLTIDVSNVANVSYTAIFAASAPSVSSNTTNSTNSTNTTTGSDNSSTLLQEGLSGGAIGGIAAGCVVAVLALIAFIIFYRRRQKKTKEQQEWEAAREQEQAHEPMHVDWEKIEDHYREIPVPGSNSPHSTNPADITKVNSPHVANEIISTSSLTRAHYSPNLTESSMVDHGNDSAYHLNKSPDVVIDAPIKPSVGNDNAYSIVKPDGN